MPYFRNTLLWSVTLLAACDSAPSKPLTIEAMFADGCDPIVSRDFCGYPFPNDAFTVADDTSPTGRRVRLHRTLARPLHYQTIGGVPMELAQDPTTFDDFDGFSGAGFLTFALPGGTLTGAASVTDIGRSMEAESPVVVIDADTGVRVPHWVEFDAALNDPTRAVYMVQAARRLEGGHRYIVAVRGLVDEAGVAVAPTRAFAALRDHRSLHGEPSVAGRRAHFEDIFERLELHGVARGDLQLAWDFTVASDAHVTNRLRRMIEAGLAEMGTGSPSYTITSTQDDVGAYVKRRITGTVTVPNYLTGTGGPTDTMILDAEGNPVRTGDLHVPFTLQIPNSAVGTTAANAKMVLTFGHGLFGDQSAADDNVVRQFADTGGYVTLAMDWWGLSTPDFGAVTRVASTGDVRDFRPVPDRGQQAMLNFIFGLRAAMRGLAADQATYVNGFPTIDPSDARYLGVSLGGIYGSVLTTVSPDIERSVLMVPGQPFSLLLPRNKDVYPPLRFLLAAGALRDEAFPPLLLGLIQMLWDRTEPTGYTHHVNATPDSTLPFAHAHEVFVMDAIGDKTVTTLGAGIMARTMGLPMLGPAPRPVWGLTEVTGPINGSAFTEFNFGPPESTTQIPNPAPGDPHVALVYGATADIPKAMAQSFLATGVATNLCSGVCDPN